MKTRQAGARGLAILVCSLLAIFQTAPDFAAAAAAGPGASSSPTGLIAMAEVVGAAERNGAPLTNGTIVSSGDVISTQANSALLLASTPQEKIWLGAETTAKLSKGASELSVSLQRGTVRFQTAGRVAVTFGSYVGLAVKSRPGSMASAELSLVDGQRVTVNVEQGSLEVVQGGESQILQPRSLNSYSTARNAATSKDSAGAMPQAPANTLTAGALHGTVVGKTLVAVPGASLTLTSASGSSYITVSDQLGHFSFQNVPPGTYSLHVVHAGYPDYDMHDVVVRSQTDSSAYVQLQSTGGGGGNHGLLIGVVAGAAAAGGIGAWAATKGKSSVSPTSTSP